MTKADASGTWYPKMAWVESPPGTRNPTGRWAIDRRNDGLAQFGPAGAFSAGETNETEIGIPREFLLYLNLEFHHFPAYVINKGCASHEHKPRICGCKMWLVNHCVPDAVGIARIPVQG